MDIKNRNKIITNPNNHDEYSDNLDPKFCIATPFINGTANVVLAHGNHFNNSIRAKIDSKGNIVEFINHARVLKRK